MPQETVVYLGLFAMLGLLLKTVVLFNVEIKSKASESFAVLCIFFIAQNGSEFLGYFTYFQSFTRLGELFIHFYLVSLYFIFPSVLLLALTLAKSPAFITARKILYSIAIILTIAHFFGFIIAGFAPLGWSVITIPGAGYWVAMSFVSLCSIFTVVYLFYQYRLNTDSEVRYNCKINLIAFLPLLIVALTVITLRVAGYNSSSAISLPLATLTFLLIMLLHTNGNLFWVSTKLKTIIAVIRMDRDSTVEAIIGQIEKVRIEEALKVSGGQQKTAAKLINVPASTLNKKISKYDISIHAA